MGHLRKNANFCSGDRALSIMNTSFSRATDDVTPQASVDRKPWWQALREADARRPDLPGEHVVVLGLGLLMLAAAGRSPSLGGRLVKAAIGGALVGRAASGRGGVARWTQQAMRLADRYLPR